MDTYRLWVLSKFPPSQFPYTSDVVINTTAGCPLLCATREQARKLRDLRNGWTGERHYVVGVYVDIYRAGSK